MPISFKGVEKKFDRVYYNPATGKWLFKCQQNPHGMKKPTTKVLESEREARQYKNSHDATYHTGEAPSRQVIGEGRTIEKAWADYVDSDSAESKDPTTLSDYLGQVKRLLGWPAFKNRVISTITVEDAKEYVKFRKRTGRSKGRQILLELFLLQRLSMVNGIATLSWTVEACFSEDLERAINANERDVPFTDPSVVQAFLDHLTGRAYVFALLKWMTGMRNAELRILRVGDFHFDADGAFVTLSLNKKGGDLKRPDWRSLGELHVEVFRRYLEGRPPMEFAFPNSQRKPSKVQWRLSRGFINITSLSRHFRRAAESAGVRSYSSDEGYAWGIGWMRHNRLTLLATLADDTGIGFTSAQRDAAMAAAAKSIGTGERSMHNHYFLLNKKNKRRDGTVDAAKMREEMIEKKRDAILIETTVTSEPDKVSIEPGRRKNTSTVLNVMTRKPGEEFTIEEIAAASGMELSELRKVVPMMAYRGTLLRIRRGVYAASDGSSGGRSLAVEPSLDEVRKSVLERGL